MSKKRLLVIEDDVDVAEMLVVYFSSQGYEVLNALDGNEGIQMARAKFPNLILLDVMLPDMDGFDVCKVLRTTTLTKYIPITFLTQRDGRADKVAGLELGADDYVTKPFDVEELRLRIQGSLRRSSREALQDPRTGLPTNAVIEDVYEGLAKKAGFAHLQVRLMGFDHFRDKYGFVAADEVLAFTGQVLSETIAQDGTPDDFVGASTEDRYTVFTFTSDLEPLAEALIKRFDDGAKNYYNFADIEQGYMVINEATDYEQRVPLMHFVITHVEGVVSSVAN
ncbi:MAG: response regulator [Chloroflexota bacterium]